MCQPRYVNNQGLLSGARGVTEMSANLQILIDSIDDGLVIVGTDGIVKLANRAATSLLRALPGKRLPSEEINGQLISLVRGYARPPVTLVIEAGPDRDDSLQLKISTSPVGGGYLINIHNLGEVQRYQTAILNLATLLRTELGESLASFNLSARDLLNKFPGDVGGSGDIGQQLELVRLEGEALIGKMVQMAGFAEAFAHKPLLASDRIELLPLLEALVQRAHPLLDSRRLKLHLRTPGTADLPVIYGSHDWLVEALYGYIEYLVCHCNVTSDLEISVRPLGNFVCLQIRNHGRGLTRSTESRAAMPFGQATHNRQGAPQKTPKTLGLGMALCKQVIELHRGGIRLEESDDEVSSLFVELPAGAPPADVNPELGAEQAKRYAEDLTRLMQRQRKAASN